MKNGRLYQNLLFRRRRALKISYLDGKQLFLSKSVVQEAQSAQNQLFRWKTAVFIKMRCLGGAECSKSAIQMENSCFLSKSGVQEVQSAQNQLFRWKTAVLSRSGVQEVQSAQNQLFRWKKAVFIKMRCLGGAECSKSAIQMENRCLSRSGVQEVQSAQNQLFRWKTAVYIKITCLGGAECSKSASWMENSCLYQNYVFRRCRVLKISYLDGKQLFLSKSGVQEVQKRVT